MRDSVLTVRETAVLALAWIGIPAACIAVVAGVIGWTPGVLYLAAVTVLPAVLTLAAPWLRTWIERREVVQFSETLTEEKAAGT